MSGAFYLEQVLPWGRNRAEYVVFFDLLDLAPETRILDCGAVPSAVGSGAPMGQGARSRAALIRGTPTIREPEPDPRQPFALRYQQASGTRFWTR